MLWEDALPPRDGEPEQESPFSFDFFSLLSKPKDYYKILEVDYDASEDAIRSNYIRLALKWHPDKQKGQDDATSRFQEINEAYQGQFDSLSPHVFLMASRFSCILSDPAKRREYDTKGMSHVYDYNIVEYLNRYKGLILTCNGLGIQQSIW
ncbi:dnaJ protein ERDJ3B isoform X1 [Syzygium oleosum]|uniref:dnaJ protein ERDJ3B isoform X1 n=1 Tax=Syzygium oleosum TaxID=219896 RepID=UPI0024B885DB|nr:dnaJ protein ERDJ3B isoform X1 [Syzygium oleosum]